MANLAALFFLAVTLPLWGGALVAALGLGFHLLFNAPWLLVAIFAVPFALSKVA